MLRHGRKAAFYRFVFPKRCSPHRTRDSADGSPAFRGRVHPPTPKTAQKKRVFPKRLLSPRGTRTAGHRVPTHTMLRAALKPDISHSSVERVIRPDTHNAACGIETSPRPSQSSRRFAVPTHTMLRAALKLILVNRRFNNESPDTHNAACGIETQRHQATDERCSCPDTHNAACGIETIEFLPEECALGVPTHTMLRAALKPTIMLSMIISSYTVPTHTMLRAALKLR